MNLLSQIFNDALTYPIFNGLMALYHLVGDFGLAIIILTVIVFLLMLPFLHRQTKVLKAQQALQPEIAALKRRYPNDNVAQMETQRQLFKERNVPLVPPIVPIIVQSLILAGVFFALNTVLRNATLSGINSLMYPFLYHFTVMPDLTLKWLSAWHISLGLPDPTHILPILAGIITFVQMRMSQPPNLAETRETLQQASHITQLLLPLLIGGITIVFAWQFAAGVALYRLAYLVLSTIRQFFITGWGSLWALPNFATATTPAQIIPATNKSKPSRRRPAKRRHNRHPKRGR
jgi:YidC/Oxa1 family membrane protein insertase